MTDLKKQLILKLAKKGVPPAIVERTIRPGQLLDRFAQQANEIVTIDDVTFKQANVLSHSQLSLTPRALQEQYREGQPDPKCDALSVATTDNIGMKRRWWNFFNYRIGDKIYGDSNVGWFNAGTMRED